MARVTDAHGNIMMPVTPGQAPAQRSNVQEWNNDLDRNAFLNLLMTQLRHQDPFNPMDDREFIAQMAQFSALEQMQHLNSTFNRFQAFSMIGQWVMGVTRDATTSQLRPVEGRVESVRMINGEPWLVMGRGADERTLRASDVQFVVDDSLARTLAGLMEISAGNAVNQNLALVGRYVQAITDDAEGRPNGFVEGKVEFVDFSGATPMLVIGNERVHLGQITSVADGPMIIGHTIGFYVGSTFHTGVISGVRVSGDDAFLVIGEREFAIDSINFVSEALRLHRSGLEISDGQASGTINQVLVYSGAVWVRLNIFDEDGNPEVGPAIRFERFSGSFTSEGDDD